MKDKQLFSTPAQIDKALADFKNLQNSSGWATVKMILDANIKEVEKTILEKPGNIKEVELDRLRGNLKIMRDLRNMPERMIAKFSSSGEEGDGEVVDVDEIYD